MSSIDFFEQMTLSDTSEEVDESENHGENSSENVPIAQKLSVLAKYIENQNNADVLIYSGDIGGNGDREFHKQIASFKKNQNVILLLSTFGGVPDSAYRMGKSLQNNYEHITIVVDDACKSSGTLLALAADAIWVTDTGEFGPLDIQLLNKDEFNERNSGLDSLQALSTLAERSSELLKTQFVNVRMGGRLSTKQALEIATRVTVGLLSPIYAQLEPLRLGEVSRSMKIAHEYGQRLDKGNLKPNALERLIVGYPSHSYVVDKTEAQDRIFNKIDHPPAHILALINILKPFASSRIDSSEPLLFHLNEFNIESEGDDKNDEEDTKATSIVDDVYQDSSESVDGGVDSNDSDKDSDPDEQ